MEEFLEDEVYQLSDFLQRLADTRRLTETALETTLRHPFSLELLGVLSLTLFFREVSHATRNFCGYRLVQEVEENLALRVAQGLPVASAQEETSPTGIVLLIQGVEL